jgi:hypothetical protein
MLTSCGSGFIDAFLSELSAALETADLFGDGSGQAVTDAAGAADPSVAESGTDPAPESSREDEQTGHVHSFREISVTRPGCETPGERLFGCVCGEEVRESVPATGHSYAFARTVAPTYESEGYDLYTCVKCGAAEHRNPTARLVHTEASYTDLCSMKSYLTAAMPHEGPVDALNIVLPCALLVTGKSADFSPYTHDEVYAILRTGHNYIMRNVIFGSNTNGMRIYACSEDDAALLASDFAWIARTVDSLGIGTSTTQREAIGIINEYLCSKLRYDYVSGSIDMHAAITTGTGVCQVYSLFFQLMCQYCGIETYYIENVERNHVYNRTVFSDGSELYTDVTWNDSSKNRVEVENAGYSEAQIASFRSKYLLKPYDEFMQLHGW